MRLRPLFLAPILLLLIMFAAPVNGVSQYVGYLASQHNAGCGTCANSVNTSGDVSGLAVVAPFTGQLVQVSVYLDNIKPTAIVIATFPAGTSPTRTLDAGCLSLCGHVDAGQSFTVQDTEGLSGLTSFAFQTITLASPVSVAGSQWIGLLFVVPSNANNWVANCQTSCNSPPISTVAALTLPAGSSTVGSSYSSIVSSPGPVIGGIFQTIGSQPSFLTQCYGNCGSPPVTLANTNTTHLTNWNTSITQFYAAQSNVNGFVVNVTVPVARSYSNGNGLTLGLYSVDPSCSTTPFTPQCPGFLQSSQLFTNPSKGNVVMLTRFSISNGQWIGVSVSGSFAGLDLNDTNTNVNLLQVAGRTPNQIVSSTNLGNRLTGLYAWVQGNTVSGGPPGSPAGCGTIPCYLANFVNALGGGVLGGLAAFGILFGFFGLTMLYVTRQHDSQGHIVGFALPMEFMVIIAVILMIFLSAAGVLHPYIPLIIIGIVAWMFTSAIWGRHKQTTV